jgi:hypothetical protein
MNLLLQQAVFDLEKRECRSVECHFRGLPINQVSYRTGVLSHHDPSVHLGILRKHHRGATVKSMEYTAASTPSMYRT